MKKMTGMTLTTQIKTRFAFLEWHSMQLAPW